MEDPAKEIVPIIQAMVQNDDVKLQEYTIRRYFSESAVLDHPIVYCDGKEEILTSYQIWILSNFKLRTTIQEVMYNQEEDYLMVRMTQYVRKWWSFDEKRMPMMIFFRLEDEPESTGDENGEAAAPRRRRKRIVFQQDHHAIDAILVNLPVIGEIYVRLAVRSLTTFVSYYTVKAVQATVGLDNWVHVKKSAFRWIGWR